MALVKFGPTVVGARGTIAGTIFSANKGGPYARGWSKGANPQSTLQTDQRGRFTSLSAAWRDLTQVQRDDWIDYADDPAQELTNSLGESYFASGANWYLRINDHLEAAGEARRNDAPTLVRPVAPILDDADTFLFITDGSFSTRVRLLPGSPNLGFNHLIVARVTTQGRTAIAAGFKFQLFAIPDGFRRIFFQPEIEATWGTIVIDQRMFVQIQSQDSHGQRSPIDSTFTDALP